jgi:hypothetical protein
MNWRIGAQSDYVMDYDLIPASLWPHSDWFIIGTSALGDSDADKGRVFW